MKKILLIITLISFVSVPVNAQSKKEQKEAKKEKEYQQTKKLIDEKKYEFIGEWATSSGGKRINLMSNPTYMKIHNESADAFFPFFGTGYSANIGSSNQGIEFKGNVENYEVSYNDKKNQINITFKAKGENDVYDVSVTAFASGSASVNINSNNRSSMNYTGKIRFLSLQ